MVFHLTVRHLLRARDLADARYSEPLTVDDLAGAAGLSRAYFSREFRRAFGESPHAYLLTRRLERAAALRALDGPHGCRHLLLRRPPERRLVHDQLHPQLRHVADRLPRAVPAGFAARADSDLRPARLWTSAIPHISRRQPSRSGLASRRPFHSTLEEHDDQDRQRPALGARPRQGTCLLHRKGRHGDARS